MSTTEIYNKYGHKTPLAADLVAWFINGYKEKDNTLRTEQGPKHGEQLSGLILNYEFNWPHNMQEIEQEIKEIIKD